MRNILSCNALRLLFVVPFAIAPGIICANQTSSRGVSELKRLSLEELSDIEVTTVTKDARPIFRTPAAIYVLTNETIRKSGARTLPDLLRLVPGVEVAQIDSAKWAVGIRGFQGYLSRAVLVLIDGRSVYTPLFAGVYWEMQDTLVEDIDRIEVIRGPGGTIWGANAVNGVINIITKKSRDTQGMLVTAGGGNIEQGELGWRYGGGNEKRSYRIWGKGLTRGSQYHPDHRNYDDWRRGQAGFRLDWQTSERDTVTIQGDAYATETGSKLTLNRFNPPSAPATEANANFSGQNLMTTWSRAYRSGSSLQLRAFYDRTDRQDLNYREVRHTLDADLVSHIVRNRHTLSWGLGARTSPSHFFQTLETLTFTPAKQTYNIFSTFVEDEFALIPNRLSVTAGTKLQYNTFSGVEFQPTVRVSWTPTRTDAIWGAFTRAVRTPSQIEDAFQFSALLQPATPLYVRLIGDAKFSSEKLLGYELGYRRKLGSQGLFSVSTFFNQYDDMLSVERGSVFAESEPPPLRAVLPLSFRNGMQAQTDGGEVEATWDFSSWWRMEGSYSLAVLNATRNPGSNDASTERQLENDTPRHKAVAHSSWQFPSNIEVDLWYRYVSSLPRMQIPAYSTGDARIAWRFLPQFELSLNGRNLLQPHHEEYQQNPGPIVGIRRSAYLQLTWSSNH